MRILMIAPEQFPLPGNSSVEICMLAIAKRLAKRHHVTILCRKFPQQSHNTQIGGVHIVRVSSKKGSYLSAILRFVKEKRFDLIQVDNRPHTMARVKQLASHTPVALFLHSLTFVPHNAKVSASLRKADLILSNSSSLTQRLSQRFPQQKAKIRTVYLGVDTARFTRPHPGKRQASRKKYNLEHSYAVLFAGRVIPRKGLSVLIKATRHVQQQIPRTRLLIAGGGKSAYVRQLKAQARKAGVAARFLGKVPHHKIHRLYQAADCFVCPSQRHEAFGLVNVEAMSTGLPVIASRIGGMKEIIQHGKNGYLVSDYRNPKSFAAYIAKIAKNKQLAAQFSKMGRQTTVRLFTWERTAARLSNIYTHHVYSARR